uniref:Putative ovule protein n=1 Tax=Solanum chacoense TaxID=4108 RepID=A0A0V0GVW8_SOLCH
MMMIGLGVHQTLIHLGYELMLNIKISVLKLLTFLSQCLKSNFWHVKLHILPLFSTYICVPLLRF